MEKRIILLFLTIGYIAFGLSMPTIENRLVITFGSKGIALMRLSEFITGSIVCGCYINPYLRGLIKKSLVALYIPMIVMMLYMVISCYDQFNDYVFLIGHIISNTVLATIIVRSITGLRAWRFPNSHEREMYDNSKNLWRSIGAIIGFGISSFIEISLKPAMILYILGSLENLG